MPRVLIHAGYELLDAIRSKRAIVLLLLYLGGSIVACNFFVSFVKNIEDQVLEGLQVSSSESVGRVAQTLWETPMFREILRKIAGNQELADHLLATSPLALYYGWLSFAFAPMVMMLIATTRVSEELSVGSARFVLVRSTLGSWIMGKLLGQTLLLLPALLISALGAWVVGWFRLSLFDAGPAAGDLIGFSLKALVYTFAWLGLATGVSQLTRSTNLATAFGFIGMILLTVVAALGRFYDQGAWAPFWKVARSLTPQGHRMDLWWPTLSHQLPAILILIALGLLYLLPGYFLLRRKDFR